MALPLLYKMPMRDYTNSRAWNSENPWGLPARSELHLTRKAWHCGMGLAIAAVYALTGISRDAGVAILGVFFLLFAIGETVRIRVPSVNRKIMKLWGPLMRANEVDRWSGTPYYVAAAMLVIAIFPKPVALLSLLYLAFGDPIASVFGILYGKFGPRFTNGKSLIGTVAGVLTCMVVTAVFTRFAPVGTADPWVVIVMGGMAGGLAEHLPLDIDDNFVIPVFSGFALWLLAIVTGV